MAIVAGPLGLAETRDVALDPAIKCRLKSRRNAAAGDCSAHMIGPGRKLLQVRLIIFGTNFIAIQKNAARQKRIEAARVQLFLFRGFQVMNSRHTDNRCRRPFERGWPVILQPGLQALRPPAEPCQPAFRQGEKWLRLINDVGLRFWPAIQNPFDKPARTASQIDDQSVVCQWRQEQQNRVLNLKITRVDGGCRGVVPLGEIGRIPAVIGHGVWGSRQIVAGGCGLALRTFAAPHRFIKSGKNSSKRSFMPFC